MNNNTIFANGDQFIGFNVDHKSGDLILRYWFIETDTIDANGRGMASEYLEDEQNRKAIIGRPIILAPDEYQGGSRGHTDFKVKNAYDYEIARIINIQRASENLINRLKRGLIQTSSNTDIYNIEQRTWVIDGLVTNETFKKLILNPATSHLIPRYVSPSFIHNIDPNGDYSRVKKAVLDHVGIVKKPRFENGKQIEGAAFGEKAKLRGACFGNKYQCLNLLQTSSSLSKCVSCPTMLLEQLTELFLIATGKKNNDDSYKRQLSFSSSNNNMSTTNEQQSTNPSQQTSKATNNSALGSFDFSNPLPEEMGTTFQVNNTGTNNTSVGQNAFTSDNKLQEDYNKFSSMFVQWIKENPNTVKQIINEKTIVAGEQKSDSPKDKTDGGNNNSEKDQSTENMKSSQSQQQQNEAIQNLMQKLNLTEEQIKTMKNEELQKQFTDLKTNMNQILETTQKTSKELEAIKKKEELAQYEKIVPKEAFTDSRGFNQDQYGKLLNYLHSINFRKDLTTILGVGLIALKNENIKKQQLTKDLKDNKIPDLFGATLQQQNQNQNQEQQEQQPQPQQVTI